MSFVIIYAISMFLDNFLEIGIIASAFKGIKVGVGIVILNAGVNMMKKSVKTPMARCLMLFGLTAMVLSNLLALNLSSIALMLAAGMISLAIFAVKGGSAK